MTTEPVKADIVAVLAEFIAESESYSIGFDPPLDVRRIAEEMNLLPVVLDMGGCLGLRPNGEVASFVWDDPQTLRTEHGIRIRNLAYHQASLRYGALKWLKPQRPHDAVVCSHCSGSGRCSTFPLPLADRIICYCGGLGWLQGEVAEQGAAADRGNRD